MSVRFPSPKCSYSQIVKDLITAGGLNQNSPSLTYKLEFWNLYLCETMNALCFVHKIWASEYSETPSAGGCGWYISLKTCRISFGQHRYFLSRVNRQWQLKQVKWLWESCLILTVFTYQKSYINIYLYIYIYIFSYNATTPSTHHVSSSFGVQFGLIFWKLHIWSR